MGTSCAARIDGLRLHYLDERGPTPDAPLLVLLHGYTVHAHGWDAFLPSLALHHRVVAPDARGHGLSDWAPDGDYTVERQADDVIALITALGYDRASLVGASMGGRSAYNVAARAPELVDRLVVIDISPGVASGGVSRISEGVRSGDRFESFDDALAAQLRVQPDVGADMIRERVRANLLLLEDGTFTWRYDVALRSGGGLPRPDADEQWKLLASVEAPTLLLQGARSDMLSSDDAQRFVATVADGQLVVVPDAGHSVAVDQPARVLAEMLSFLVDR